MKRMCARAQVGRIVAAAAEMNLAITLVQHHVSSGVILMPASKSLVAEALASWPRCFQ